MQQKNSEIVHFTDICHIFRKIYFQHGTQSRLAPIMGIPLDHTIFTHLATLRTLSEPHYRIHTKQDQLDLYLPQSYKL